VEGWVGWLAGDVLPRQLSSQSPGRALNSLRVPAGAPAASSAATTAAKLTCAIVCSGVRPPCGRRRGRAGAWRGVAVKRGRAGSVGTCAVWGPRLKHTAASRRRGWVALAARVAGGGRGRQVQAEGGRWRQRGADGGRGGQLEAEVGRWRQREAGGGRGRQVEAEGEGKGAHGLRGGVGVGGRVQQRGRDGRVAQPGDEVQRRGAVLRGRQEGQAEAGQEPGGFPAAPPSVALSAPTLAAASTSAPPTSSAATTSVWPSRDAACSGAKPS
jgi:hypothetical protein